MSESVPPRPMPRVNTLNAPYWKAAKRHELRIQRCTACGHWRFPPASRCPSCLSTEYEWAPVSGRGRVWSWIVMWQRYFPAFESRIPYNIAYVELDEGPRLMTSIVECDQSELRCDMPVEVVFEDVSDEITLPVFRPVRS